MRMHYWLIPPLLAAVSLCTADRHPNLLKTPGFDEPADEHRPRNWQFTEFNTGGSPVYDPSADRNGGPAVGITADDDTERGAWQQTINIDGLNGVVVSGWYRTANLQAADRRKGACVRATYLKAEGGWSFIEDKRLYLPKAETWHQFRHVFVTVPNAARLAVELFNFFATGTVWFDDVSARAATKTEVIDAMAEKLDKPADANQVSYSPENGKTVSVNPPPFIWVPAEGIETYILQYSQDPGFSETDATTFHQNADITVYTPTRTLPPGQWHWRYGFTVETGQTVFSKTRKFRIPEQAVNLPRPKIDDVMAKIPHERPRAYFTPQKITEVRAEADDRYKQLVEPLVNSAEKKLGEKLFPEPGPLPKSGQERSKAYQKCFRNMRPFTSGMKICAMAYACTGDERFAEEAKRRLLHFATWDIDGPTSVWANDEAAMDIAKHAPRSFDWICDTLTDDEKQTCIEFLGDRIQQLHELHLRMPFHSRPYSSHPGRMIGFVIEGGIVLAHEDPRAKKWLDYTLRLLWSVYPIWGGDDGGWHEGISYWTAYNRMMFPMVEELDRIGIPWKKDPYLSNAGWFGLYCAYPHRKHRAFGDGQQAGIGRGQGSLLYMLASLYDNRYFRWHAAETGGHSIGPARFNMQRPDMKPKPPKDIPQARAFKDAGWVAMHSDMPHPKDNVMLLFHSTPYGSISHNHANQNAFVLEAFTQPLAISSGYYQRYASPHHAQWTWATRAHNSILVNGKGQKKRSHLSRGYITEFDNTDQFAYTTGDATEAYNGRLEKFLRHILFCRPDYFVIFDELVSPKPTTYQWLLHAKRPMKLDEPQLQLVSAYEDARLAVQFLAPDTLQFKQSEGFPVAPVRPDSPTQYHFTASTTQPAEKMYFLTVLEPYHNGAPRLVNDCQLLPADGGIAARIGNDIVAWRFEDAAKLQASDLTTSARVTALRRNENGDVADLFTHGRGTVTVAGREIQ